MNTFLTNARITTPNVNKPSFVLLAGSSTLDPKPFWLYHPSMQDPALPAIDLFELAVPFRDAVSLTVGSAVSRQILDIAKSRYLDHLIVVDEAGHPVGFIPTSALQHALDEPAPWVVCIQLVFKHTLHRHITLDALLEAFESRTIAAVISHPPEGSDRFVTFSDLNKHPVRSAMYPLFAELEAHLATLIERRHEDPWRWIAHLDRDKQARIVGYWELSKRDGVDIGPIAGATLHELLTIVRKDSALRDSLGITNGNKWDSLAHSINELRNLVMHPVRPMFSNPDDLAKTRQKLLSLSALVAISKSLARS